MSAGVIVGTGAAASAHTVSTNATCENLAVSLSSYQASGGTNRIQVTIDGATQVDAAFGAAYSRAATFDDPTVAHDWSVKVSAWDDPDGAKGWSFTKSGRSAPCQPPDACESLAGIQQPGTACTPPADEKETREVQGTPDCYHESISIQKQERTGTYKWDGNSWKLGPMGPWTTTGTTTVPSSSDDCEEPEVTAAAPSYTRPSCTDAPQLTYSDGEGYFWILSGPESARVLDAVAEDGYVLTGRTHYGPYRMTSWTVKEKLYHGCVGELADVSVQQSTDCDTNPSITVPVSDLVSYAIDGGSWSDLAAGDYLVTATLSDGAAEFANAAGWTVTGRTATRTVRVEAPLTCVTPSASVSPAVCVPDEPGETTAGSIILGTEPGVTYTVRDADDEVVDPTDLAPGVYTVVATALDGYEVVDGNGFVDGVLELTVPTAAEDCDTEAPVVPAVQVTDDCYTENDAVSFEAENEYWTAEVTDSSHVTFTAKAGYYFLDDTDAKVTQLVLEHAPLTDEQCPLLPGAVGASCVGDVPYLAYDLDLPAGFKSDDPTPLTITFLNPSGPDFVRSNLPLSGKMLWPGASDGNPQMWPGWDLVDGEYVNVGNDRFGWTRNGVKVAFDVNPHYETTLTYPPASAKCANPPSSTPPANPPTSPAAVFRPPPALPNTGGPSGVLTGLGALLLLAGTALVSRSARKA